MTLYVKNMVCHRCIMAVQRLLEELNIQYISVRLGEVELSGQISDDTLMAFSDKLSAIGFALIDNKRSRIIEKIKNEIIWLIHHAAEQPKTNLSNHLAGKLHYDYNYLSNLFSEIEGTTIEKYHIAQKIERVKELLVYDELSLGEIAFQLGYSSVAYLSNQFKKVTGLTPSHFKLIRHQKRKPLDKVT